ncbi:hypothetical protein [Phycicoccus sp. Soil803]|uniref:hypothetical protein n=1 Tax=Phycicoccus sp. Soil803 TaxID=1736415 RepID=UPI000709847D|nr:hypothetical protein [Phycicoccus sp. Soil803]KRF25678.1 hypothetical protein ASG95_15235 [Phycicoccus sp. Soil803]
MTGSRRAVLRAALIGLGLGVAWGAAARVWMRLVSTTPEFSWAGTAIILGFSGLLGLLLGLSWRARHATGRRRWFRLLFLPGLILFAGQGAPLAPGLLVAGPLLRRPGVLARAGTVLAVAGPAVALWWTERLDEDTMLSAPTRVQVWLLIGMPVLSTALAFAGHLVLGPLGQRDHSASPERARNRRRSDSRREVPAGPA